MNGVATVIFALVAVTSATIVPEDNVSLKGYHMKTGIPMAARIRKYEEALAAGASVRIVGGQTTDISEVPYQVGFLIQILWIFTAVCGGSLISSNRIVTAAHCHSDGIFTAQSFTAVLGSNTLFSGGTRIESNDIEVHPGWDPDNIANDVAVLRISSVTYSNVIQAIALPSGDEISQSFDGQNGLASGFGITSDGGSIETSQTISSVTLKVISNAQCAAVFGSYVHDYNICTSGNDRQSTCSGDSGGPLAVTSGGKRILVGITSFGANTCEGGYPSAYTRVTSFVPWIQSA